MYGELCTEYHQKDLKVKPIHMSEELRMWRFLDIIFLSSQLERTHFSQL